MLGWTYTLFFVFLGSAAAIFGHWLERAGPRKAGFVAALCWCGGLFISAFGVYTHQIWLMWLGSGVIGGIGLGLGYISPVSTLIKWFPDHRGVATGLAIMGFGGGAMIGAPLADRLMNLFANEASVGVWQTFVALGAIYFVSMMLGAFGYRLPPPGWQPPSGAVKTDEATRYIGTCARERSDPHAAVLAVVGRSVSQRERGHRRNRHGLADAAGGLRRSIDRDPGEARESRGRPTRASGHHCGGICRVAVAVQHRWTHCLGIGLGRPRPQTDVHHLLSAGLRVVRISPDRG